MGSEPKKNRSILYWASVAFYLTVIFIMSSIPGYELPKLDFAFSDKMVHFLEFGMLGIFLYNAFRHTSPVKKPVLWSIAAGMIWGISDELHQLFVPGRMCSIWDFAADSAGIVTFVIISMMLNDSFIKNKSI